MKRIVNKKRIEVFDFAKAIAIVLVIWGHTTGNFDTPMFRRVLYSFHMPLFFILAGLCIRPRKIDGIKGWEEFIRKNILALLVPYFIWGLIYAPFSFSIFPGLLYGSHESISAINTLTSLWYLTTFFLARIFAQIAVNILYYIKFKNVDLGCIIFSVIFMAMGFIIPHIEGGYFFGFDVAFTSTAFILLGVGLRRWSIILSQGSLFSLIVFTVISAIIFYFGTIFRGDSLDLCLMCKASYGNKFWFIINGIFGSTLVMGISKLISRTSRESAFPFSTTVISYIGQNTLGIYLLHKPLLQQVILPFTQSIIGNYCCFEITSLIATLITLPICMILCFIINRYIPQLLGEFPRTEEK